MEEWKITFQRQSPNTQPKRIFIHKSRSTYVQFHQIAIHKQKKDNPWRRTTPNVTELTTSDLRLRLGSVDDLRYGERVVTRGVGRDLKSRRVVTSRARGQIAREMEGIPRG